MKRRRGNWASCIDDSPRDGFPRRSLGSVGCSVNVFSYKSINYCIRPMIAVTIPATSQMARQSVRGDVRTAQARGMPQGAAAPEWLDAAGRDQSDRRRRLDPVQGRERPDVPDL